MSATPSSMQVTSPPSPSANRFLVGKKLNVEHTPVVATPAAPNAWAASSSSGSPRAASSSSEAGRPKRCTGTIALVRSVITADDGRGIEVQRHRVDVGEHRRRADAGDRLGRRVERERRADDLVAAPDPHRLERQHERVGSVRDADRVRHAEIRGGLPLERLDLGAEDEATRLEHGAEALHQLGDERRVLRLDVDEGDHDRPSVPPALRPPFRLRGLLSRGFALRARLPTRARPRPAAAGADARRRSRRRRSRRRRSGSRRT